MIPVHSVFGFWTDQDGSRMIPFAFGHKLAKIKFVHYIQAEMAGAHETKTEVIQDLELCRTGGNR